MSIVQVAPRRFPSGGSKYVAVARVDRNQLCQKYGLTFDEEGRGYAIERAAMVVLNGRDLLSFIFPELEDGSSPLGGMFVVADTGANTRQILEELRRELGLGRADVAPWSPEDGPAANALS